MFDLNESFLYHHLQQMKILALILLSVLIVCCKTVNNDEDAVSESAYSTIDNPVIRSNQEWKIFINEDLDGLSDFYTENAIKVSPDGAVISGPELIIQSLKNSKKYWIGIDTIYTNKNVIADRDQRYEYEIGTFITSEGSEFNHLVIWNTQNAPKTRELEFIAQSRESENGVLKEINLSRDKWIKLCNEHNSTGLVEELYKPNAIYYNHKPVVIGTIAIIKEYGYMNNENYNLHLEPIIVKLVSSKVAFEIGQCSGSYNGKYILVWEKNSQGAWRVLMDSNI